MSNKRLSHTRRLSNLLVTTLAVSSLLFGIPKSQSPAYGLVEAGFVDGVVVGRGLRVGLTVDRSTGGPVVIDTESTWAAEWRRREAYYVTTEDCTISVPQQLVHRAYLDGSTAGEALHASLRYCALVSLYIPSSGEKLYIAEASYEQYHIDSISIPDGNTLLSRAFGDLPFVSRNLGLNQSRGQLLFAETTAVATNARPPETSRRLGLLSVERASVEAIGSILASSPCGAAYNEATNRWYVVDDEPGRVTVLDGSTLARLSEIEVASYIGFWARRQFCPIAVNPEKNRIYLLRIEPQFPDCCHILEGGTAYLVVIDGETNTVIEEKEVANRTARQALAVDPRTGKVFVYAPTEDNPRRVQVFSDSTPETLIGDLQTGRYTQWFFAEGTTRPGYKMWLTLASPDQPNRVRISFLTAQGQPGPFFREVDLPANTRVTINVNDQIGEGLDVSTKIVSVWGKPFYAERPIYFAGGEAHSQGGNLGSGVHN